MPAGLTKVLKPLGSRSADAERIGAVEFFGEHICRWAVEVQTTAWPTAFIHYATLCSAPWQMRYNTRTTRRSSSLVRLFML